MRGGQNDGGDAENPKRSEVGKGFGRLLARPLLEGGERCEDECEKGEASATISGKKAAVAIPSKLNDPLRAVSSKCSISRKQFQCSLSMA